MRADNIPMYDVTPPMTIVISPWLYLVMALLMISVLVGMLGWKRWKQSHHHNGEDTRLSHYQTLMSVDLNNPKKAAYTISASGYQLVQSHPELMESYQRLHTLLEPHKYALTVKPLSEHTIEAYKQFCREAYEKMS